MRPRDNTDCYQNRTRKYPARTGKYAGNDYRTVNLYNERVAHSVRNSLQQNSGFRRERDMEEE